ncbi:nuclear fragile X mental retardation-interacting protein 1-domain-containing protein [Fomitopsis betulina]|nr:nuclear fragile X mental retardation-interacting protein 1-domain-containing protein [Fomitopsis betulina]
MRGHPSSQAPHFRGRMPGPSHPYTPNVGAFAAQAAAAALSYPYTQFQPTQAPHYAQAYAQFRQPGIPGTTADGYTLSSTYVPGSYNAYAYASTSAHPPAPQKPSYRGQVQPHWYQPGDCDCTQTGCRFKGSKKAVEVHMMDRHLIYPPGWDKRKKRDDWDADPSLKGKPVPIQGTTVKLDTPEAIEAWVAERKKRFPTALRVQEKEQKMEEAIARGQLRPQDYRFPNKRRKLEDGAQGGQYQQQSRGRGGGRGRGRGRGGGHGQGNPATREPYVPHALPPKPVSSDATTNSAVPARTAVSLPVAYDSESSESESQSDGAPEMTSSKAVPKALEVQDEPPLDVPTEDVEMDGPRVTAKQHPKQPLRPPRKPHARQPRRPLNNPFAARPSLLKNLLTPEIRMTVSNLSQAIRFLVDNDFLENVELRPGQATEKMIEVIGSSGAEKHNEQAVIATPSGSAPIDTDVVSSSS